MTAAERMKQYEDLFAQSQAYNPAKFQEDFEKSYGEATNYNKDLYDERANVIGQAQALPNQLREQYYSSAIRNPLAQESLISTRRGNLTSDITSLTDFLGARGARYQDVLGKHLAGYQTSAEQARMAAENEWRMYQDQVQQDQFAAQMRKGSGGGGQGGTDIANLLQLLTGGGSTKQVDPKEGFMQMVREVALARKSRSLPTSIDKAHADLLAKARDLNLNVDPRALWQQLGNDIGVPQTLRLFL